jgi:LruC domain-containing protein
VAYEDLYPVPGDADYNDFVARYFVVENYANIKVPKEPEEIEEELEKDKPVEKDEELVEQTELVSLYGEATAVDKVAGYNHRFGIVIDFPDLTADLLEVTYYDSAGALRSATFEDVENQAVIWLFENTKYAKDKDQPATFFLQFYDGVDRSGVSYAPYDPVLQVISNGPSKAYDIHLIGEDPFPDGVDTQHLDFIDGNGYPWALLVPDDWKHPAECQYIGNAYPLFDDWRLSSGEKFAYWYLYPVDTNTEPDNHPPAVVTDETGERKSNPELVAGAADEQHYQLELDADEPDPDEDDVYFLSSPLPEGLADKMILDETTGMVTFTAEVPEDDYLVYFWSEDEHHASTISDPFKVTFSFRSGVANTPPVASFPGDYEVVAAGNTAVIGRYEIVGTNEGRPLYQQVTDLNVQPYYLYYLTADDFGDTALWVIHAAVGTMAAGAQYYNSDASASTAPEGQWDAVEASGTATGRRLPISGSLNVGGTLTVRYQYSDADGDEQDLEATEIRWLRFDSETAITGKVILGAVTDTYTTTMEDAGKWLRVEVTPVDKREAVGDPALSSAVYIGGS